MTGMVDEGGRRFVITEDVFVRCVDGQAFIAIMMGQSVVARRPLTVQACQRAIAAFDLAREYLEVEKGSINSP